MLFDQGSPDLQNFVERDRKRIDFPVVGIKNNPAHQATAATFSFVISTWLSGA